VKCAERCLPEGVPDAALKEMVRVQQQDYGSSWDKDVTIYDGIIECLTHLQAEHTAIAVLSNKNHDFTLQCVERFFGDFRFDAVVGFSAEVPHKPDPTGAIAIARELGLHPAEIAFVGDTATDMHTAVAAGNLPVGALWGFREADELKKAGARHIIEHPTDLFAVMEGETK
ncbi:MAG: HAD family hydrolase, partial [Pseudomonadales bacterium]|nr:HAD family hydrolase [Pseudomonadales bacterium]